MFAGLVCATLAQAQPDYAIVMARMRTRALARLALLLLGLAPAPIAWSLAAGDPAPACAAQLLDGARTVSLADYRGQVVYLDFWASWCAPCRESFPFMNELQRELATKGLQIVAVSVDKTAEDAKRFLARYPASFTIVLDAAANCPTAFRLEGMPSSYVIDRGGVVRAVHTGFHNSDRDEIRRQLVETLQGGKR
jgi:cytochrome c biogenesis protein CcmG/thiol:disulfide interchange protein DsbE